MTKPIDPKDIDDQKKIPAEVIAAANELIAERWDGREARFNVDELDARARKLLGKPRHRFKDGELDIEVVFSKHGWVVDYDNPGYNESYVGFWTFRKRRARRT